MATFICRGCQQPVHVRSVDAAVPAELQYCRRCEGLRTRFEHNLADASANKDLPNSEYWLDKTASDAGLEDGTD